MQIGAYEKQGAACIAYDPRAAKVAELVGAEILTRLPSARVEHVGSTAVPGCAGKGVVDLALLYVDGELVLAREELDAMGFQRQSGRDPFPEDRPMRVGAVKYDGQRFLLHVHVIAATADEARELLVFRDALRKAPELRDAYVVRKREILASGIDDSLDYCYAKSGFIENTLRRIGEREDHHPQ